MFLGMCNYYVKFIPWYIDISTLHYNLLQKNTKINQTTDCDTALKQTKRALSYDPVLGILDFNANFIVETNASVGTVGVVLMQYNWLVALMSKILNFSQCNYHTMDCKLLAIVHACKRWHSYLDFKKTIVVANFKPLIGIHIASNLSKR